MTADPLARRASASPWIPRWDDAAYAPGATALAMLLLWYLHGAWQPWWALACGLGAGVLLRRVVAQGYAAFPPFLKRPLDAGVALVGTFLGCWITLAGYPIPYWILRWREALALPAAAALLGLGIAAVVYTFRRLQLEIEEHEARLAALREAELRARLRALQAQINPHFLFNALNSLAEMVHGDADEAEQMVGDLAHLLRYSLRSSASGLVTLDQELESVRRYLRLERVRLGARLRVEEDIEDGVGAAELPGLVLQPLVENAIKHAVAPRPEGGSLRIVARRDTGGVVVIVEDDGPSVLGWLFKRAWLYLGALIVGCVLLRISGRRFGRFADALIDQPGRSVGIGFVSLVTVPAFAVLAMVLVLPLQLGVLTTLLYLVALYVAGIIAALAIGRWILNRMGRTGASAYAALALGLLALHLLLPIPFLGFVVRLVAVVAGLGAMWVAAHNGHTEEAVL